MYFYVQLDSNNVAVALSELAGEVIANNMIQVPDFNFDYLGRVYDRATGTFGDRLPVEPVEPEPTALEIINAKLDYVMMLAEAGVM